MTQPDSTDRREHRTAPAPADLVAEHRGGCYWSVEDCRWVQVRPTLPDDLVELLAPPVLVGTVPADPPPGPAGDRPRGARGGGPAG